MQKKKGISLIVLVITIIVMIVLAGAIILTLNNSGIIEKAQNAVDKTNEATVKEVASMAWAEAYASGARTEDELKAGVLAAFEKNNINEEEYLINVTTSGVFVKLLKNAWIKEGFTVVKGDQVLEIGDVVNYDAGVSTYTAGWKVLGADSEGNLLIMSAGDVKTNFRLGYEDSMTTVAEKLAESAKDYGTGVAQLNAECEPYGHGKGVVGVARSITVEDVNAVTGCGPTGEETVVTFKYNGTTRPAYESVVGSGTIAIDLDGGFYYYDGEKVVHINDLTSGTNGETFATLRCNYYMYDVDKDTTLNSTQTKVYSMLFGNDDASYWLASSYIQMDIYPMFGLRQVTGSYVWDTCLFLAVGSSYKSENGIRAVVTLSSDIQFTGSSEAGWSY